VGGRLTSHHCFGGAGLLLSLSGSSCTVALTDQAAGTTARASSLAELTFLITVFQYIP
jgi:hypothetical protein